MIIKFTYVLYIYAQRYTYAYLECLPGFQGKFLWSCPFLQQRLQNAHSTHNIGREDEFCKRENGKKIIKAERTQFFIKMIFTKKYSAFLCKIPWARVSKHLPCKAQQFFNKLVRWLSVDWNKKKQCYVKRYLEYIRKNMSYS